MSTYFCSNTSGESFYGFCIYHVTDNKVAEAWTRKLRFSDSFWNLVMQTLVDSRCNNNYKLIPDQKLRELNVEADLLTIKHLKKLVSHLGQVLSVFQPSLAFVTEMLIFAFQKFLSVENPLYLSDMISTAATKSGINFEQIFIKYKQYIS